jgi:hypothetical protein
MAIRWPLWLTADLVLALQSFDWDRAASVLYRTMDGLRAGRLLSFTFNVAQGPLELIR